MKHLKKGSSLTEAEVGRMYYKESTDEAVDKKMHVPRAQNPCNTSY
jgi:hypothetical protein